MNLWDIYDFPRQYIPRAKYGYYPPAFVLGAAVTFSEYEQYAAAKRRPPSCPSDSEHRGVGREIPQRGINGCIFVEKVWTRSDTPFILPIISSYGLGKRFPEEECEKLLDDLESVGIQANVDWYLTEDYSKWAEEELFDWSKQYKEMMAKRKRSKSQASGTRT
ncbi:hypothetical protein K435DRAFT_786279 [Dendrothele bispora CBS 962.96]|uniref:Uncharacterized protein n=1 Tax=Dendrothele bispora (strain CBS 962.96) TaxID=1314807 RepID=A0A4S8KSL6_DENBC|nr:hypothetical protein K435DRAFT_786279 [Dendrothele bispora CBS 962.96]